MTFIDTITIPSPPSANLGFYENTHPECILSSPSAAQLAEIPYGVYDSLSWNSETPAEQLEEATTWGTKTLPGAGPFYFANHADGNPTIGYIGDVVDLSDV